MSNTEQRKAIISCPGCLRQYEALAEMSGKLARCGFCAAHFSVILPELSISGESAIVFENPVEPWSSFLREGCATLVANMCRAFYLADVPLDRERMLAFVRTLPELPSDIMNNDWRTGFCFKLLGAAFTQKRDEATRIEIMDYFLERIPYLSWRPGRALRESAIGFISGFDWRATLPPPRVRMPGPVERWAARRGW